MQALLEYLLTKNNNKTVDDVDELIKNFPSETLRCNTDELRKEFNKLIELGYIPLTHDAFYSNNPGNSCFYLFKHLTKKNEYVITSITTRSNISNQLGIIISYTSEKTNIDTDDSSMVVSMKWQDKHTNMIFNMQEWVLYYLTKQNFGKFERVVYSQNWLAKGKFHMMSTQKIPKPIYNVESFFK